MAQGVVDEVGERAFYQLQVTVQLQAPRCLTAQRDAGHRIGFRRVALKLLHRVADQFVQVEALAVQHFVARLQRGQLEQLLRQAAHFVALGQSGVEDAAASVRRLLVVRAGREGGPGQGFRQRFKMAVQSGQRRAQIVCNTGHGFAVGVTLFLLACGLSLQTPGHVREGVSNVAHFIATRLDLLGYDISGCELGRRVAQLVVAEFVVEHAGGQAAQWLGQLLKCKRPKRQRDNQTYQGCPARPFPDAPQAELACHLVACLTVEHHVQITGRSHIAFARREHGRAEYSRHARSHRVGAAQGQCATRQEVAHGLQIDLVLSHHAGLADVGVNATVSVQHINLHAWVDHHQHR